MPNLKSRNMTQPKKSNKSWQRAQFLSNGSLGSMDIRSEKDKRSWRVAGIAASIKEFGFNNPILVDGGKVIIAGHGRHLRPHRSLCSRRLSLCSRSAGIPRAHEGQSPRVTQTPAFFGRQHRRVPLRARQDTTGTRPRHRPPPGRGRRQAGCS
jgi:hypothetical protein